MWSGEREKGKAFKLANWGIDTITTLAVMYKGWHPELRDVDPAYMRSVIFTGALEYGDRPVTKEEVIWSLPVKKGVRQ